MASVVYPKFKEGILQGTWNLSSAVVRGVLIDTGTYTYSAAHDFYNDLSGVVATESGALATKTFTNGTFDADNITFTAATGVNAEAIVLFVDTGNAATDALICYIDSASSGLPVLPNGGDIVVAWNASGIFSL